MIPDRITRSTGKNSSWWKFWQPWPCSPFSHCLCLLLLLVVQGELLYKSRRCLTVMFFDGLFFTGSFPSAPVREMGMWLRRARALALLSSALGCSPHSAWELKLSSFPLLGGSEHHSPFSWLCSTLSWMGCAWCCPCHLCRSTSCSSFAIPQVPSEREFSGESSTLSSSLLPLAKPKASPFHTLERLSNTSRSRSSGNQKLGSEAAAGWGSAL